MSDIVTFVSTATDPYERGTEYAAAHAPKIGATVAAYDRLWRFLDPSFDIAQWGGRALAAIHELAPRAAAEIAGLAAGSGRTEEEIAALNARTEVLAGLAPRGTGAAMVNECSTVVSTAPGRAPLAAQTWDWYPAMRDNWMLWTLETEAGRRITTLTEYGVLAKIGVNDAGLGVMLNMLHHDADDQTGHDPRVGFPVHVMLRTLLEQCSSVAEAGDLVSAEPFSASSALTVVDRDGDAVSFEVFPAGVGEVKPEAGLLVRTNHFVSAEGEPGCQAGLVDDNSWVRRDHLVASLSAETPGSAADIHRAMTHHDVAGPVCRHAADPDSPELVETATLATVALDVAHGTLAAQRGGPCGRD